MEEFSLYTKKLSLFLSILKERDLARGRELWLNFPFSVYIIDLDPQNIDEI